MGQFGLGEAAAAFVGGVAESYVKRTDEEGQEMRLRARENLRHSNNLSRDAAAAGHREKAANLKYKQDEARAERAFQQGERKIGLQEQTLAGQQAANKRTDEYRNSEGRRRSKEKIAQLEADVKRDVATQNWRAAADKRQTAAIEATKLRDEARARKQDAKDRKERAHWAAVEKKAERTRKAAESRAKTAEAKAVAEEVKSSKELFTSVDPDNREIYDRQGHAQYLIDQGGEVKKKGEALLRVSPQSGKGVTWTEALERARQEASDKAGLFRSDETDFGPLTREEWITKRATEIAGFAGPSASKTAAPGAAPSQSKGYTGPAVARTQKDVDDFKANAKPGDTIVINGKTFRK